MRRVTSLISVGIVVIVSLFFAWHYWLSGTLFFTTQKVCQLTGEEDRQYPRPNNKTAGHGFGITGSDLGIPVAHQGTLYLLFGDTRDVDPDLIPDLPGRADDGMPNNQAAIVAQRLHSEGADSIASMPPSADADRCPKLDFVMDAPAPDGRPKFRSLKLGSEGPATPEGVRTVVERELGNFETPVGGFSNGSSMFVFFTVRDSAGQALGDIPAGGRTVLAMAPSPQQVFEEIMTVPSRNFQWISSTVVDARQVPNLPQHLTDSQVVLMWGTGPRNVVRPTGTRPESRAGYPYFAVAPTTSVGLPNSWYYFKGSNTTGAPIFSNSHTDAVPLPPFKSAVSDRCMGEFSVGYLVSLHQWAMLYACDDDQAKSPKNRRGIFIRFSSTPWGPWSDPHLVFEPRKDRGYCHFMHSRDSVGCRPGDPNPGDHGFSEVAFGTPGDRNTRFYKMVYGGEYAPQLIPSYTKVDGEVVSIYFVMSTWNPYQSVLMRTRIMPLRVLLLENISSLLGRAWKLIATIWGDE